MLKNIHGKLNKETGDSPKTAHNRSVYVHRIWWFGLQPGHQAKYGMNFMWMY
jgi:hypothetical protein